MKKIISLIIIGCLVLTGCGKVVEKNITGSLEEIISKLYEGINEEELPMGLTNVEVNAENLSTYLGDVKDIKYKEIIASESMVGSIAHSVVLIRLESASDAEKVVNEIKEKANPAKWICVEAENVYVQAKGDLVVLIMSNELAEKIKTNFENLK